MFVVITFSLKKNLNQKCFVRRIRSSLQHSIERENQKFICSSFLVGKMTMKNPWLNLWLKILKKEYYNKENHRVRHPKELLYGCDHFGRCTCSERKKRILQQPSTRMRVHEPTWRLSCVIILFVRSDWIPNCLLFLLKHNADDVIRSARNLLPGIHLTGFYFILRPVESVISASTVN